MANLTALKNLIQALYVGGFMTAVTLKFWDDDLGFPVEVFDDKDVDELNKVATNTDSNIFAWKISEELTPEQSGALLSRYSRTSYTGRFLYLKEFLPNKNRGREFFLAWLVDYGDDSIQEMSGGLPVSCEYISNLAAKEIEDTRIGASFIEKSTRYVFFDKKLPNGEYMFYKDREILASRFGDSYIELMNSLFDSYVKGMPEMIKYIRDRNPIDAQVFRVGEKQMKISDIGENIEEESGITDKDINKAYENAIKANALDFMRDYLPMATLTHVGINANARAYENMLNKMLASPLAESRWIASRMYNEISKIAPSLIHRVEEKYDRYYQNLLAERAKSTSEYVKGIITNDLFSENKRNAVELVDYTGKGAGDPNSEASIKIATALLYRFGAGISLRAAQELAAKIGQEKRDALIAMYVGKRSNRRNKPGRAFEHVDYLFDFTGRVGIYRDLQRHRIGTQERQDFSTKLGYEMRSEYNEIGIADDYKSKMGDVDDLYGKLHEILPHQAQYVVTFGYDLHWYYRFNARQLYHFCELRTTPSGHPDYRKVAQSVYEEVAKVHPTIAKHMDFVDMAETRLGRLNSEIRIAQKKKALT
ncbi:MAG: FAD-dependent thymidylate synthase [Candidatus Micrarchaeaceae archaeon]